MNWIFLDVEKFNLNISRNGRKHTHKTQHFIENRIFLTFPITSLQVCAVVLYRQYGCEVELILLKV